MKKTELKPCPFCGGEAKLYETYDGFWQVQCCGIGCGCGTMQYKEKRTPVRIWNRRANDVPTERS